jgi:hypothetical protein
MSEVNTVPYFGMFTDAGNKEVSVIVEHARANNLTWPQTYNLLCKMGTEQFEIVERWKQLSEKVGFKFEKTIKMMLNVRPGQGNNRQQNALKFEGIYVFSKK